MERSSLTDRPAAVRGVIHGLTARSADACAHCGADADPAAGVFLGRLYAGERFCRPCGRRERHCACHVAAATTDQATDAPPPG